MNRKNYYIFFLFVLFLSCHAPAHITQVEKHQYAIGSKEYASVDSTVWQTIVPYKSKLDAEVDVVIGKTAKALTKDQPEGLLGNFVTDLVMEISPLYYYPPGNSKIDFCFLNNGGLRNNIPEGEITRRNIFEVMPFENELVVLSMNGTQIKQLLKFIVSKGGIPVSNLRMKIKEKAAAGVMINNIPFDSTKIYKAVTSDYLANGGDNLFFLAEAKKEYVGLKIRDAIIEYCMKENKQGKLLDSKLDNRIEYE
ncbi:MAG: 5'-nucleotidase C-terminal domain-containing protein [Bacteroidia bacterium]